MYTQGPFVFVFLVVPICLDVKAMTVLNKKMPVQSIHLLLFLLHTICLMLESSYISPMASQVGHTSATSSGFGQP